jgi:signal transduction histidine kinase
VSITDSGIGIKKKNQDKIFKMFGSIKDEKKKINTNGIGLGLVISKLIVNKFGGIIDFVSKYHRGSTFFYTI